MLYRMDCEHAFKISCMFLSKKEHFLFFMFILITCGSHTSAYTSKVLITLSHVEDINSVSTIVGRYGLTYLRQVSFDNGSLFISEVNVLCRSGQWIYNIIFIMCIIINRGSGYQATRKKNFSPLKSE